MLSVVTVRFDINKTTKSFIKFSADSGDFFVVKYDIKQTKIPKTNITQMPIVIIENLFWESENKNNEYAEFLKNMTFTKLNIAIIPRNAVIEIKHKLKFFLDIFFMFFHKNPHITPPRIAVTVSAHMYAPSGLTKSPIMSESPHDMPPIKGPNKNAGIFAKNGEKPILRPPAPPKGTKMLKNLAATLSAIISALVTSIFVFIVFLDIKKSLLLRAEGCVNKSI